MSKNKIVPSAPKIMLYVLRIKKCLYHNYCRFLYVLPLFSIAMFLHHFIEQVRNKVHQIAVNLSEGRQSYR